METAEWYRWFSENEARGRSPVYEQLTVRIADDRELLALLERAPQRKRQPNLFLAAVKYLGGITSDFQAFRSFVLEHAPVVEALLHERSTQTNEVGRCAALLPALAALPPPLALLEVGASAGLCLLPDRYGYDYAGKRVGDVTSPCQLRCSPIGPVPVPNAVPRIVWRAGIDLSPLDVQNEEQVTWLEACIWPDQEERLHRLRAAVDVARREPPRLVAGDLIEQLELVAADAPPSATLVVFHSAVLNYLPPARRGEFAELVAALECVWISAEGRGVIESVATEGLDIKAPRRDHFVIARQGAIVIALCDAHGSWLSWSNV